MIFFDWRHDFKGTNRLDRCDQLIVSLSSQSALPFAESSRYLCHRWVDRSAHAHGKQRRLTIIGRPFTDSAFDCVFIFCGGLGQNNRKFVATISCRIGAI